MQSFHSSLRFVRPMGFFPDVSSKRIFQAYHSWYMISLTHVLRYMLHRFDARQTVSCCEVRKALWASCLVAQCLCMLPYMLINVFLNVYCVLAYHKALFTLHLALVGAIVLLHSTWLRPRAFCRLDSGCEDEGTCHCTAWLPRALAPFGEFTRTNDQGVSRAHPSTLRLIS